MSALMLPAAFQSRARIWYFSESRYSSLPCAHRHVLDQLEAAVDAVERRQRRREQQPDAERRTPAVTEILVEMSGVFANKLPRIVLDRRAARAAPRRTRAARTPLFFHVKYVYDIVKPSLASCFIAWGA